MRRLLLLLLVAGCRAHEAGSASSGSVADAAAAAPVDAASVSIVGEAGAPIVAAVRVLDPSVKWSALPRVELSLSNNGSSPLVVMLPGSDNSKLELARVSIAPLGAPDKYSLSPWPATGATRPVVLAPGATERVALAAPAALGQQSLPGSYTLSVVYELSDYQEARMKEVGLGAAGAWRGHLVTASVPFEILSDGSAALAARKAANDGVGLESVEAALHGCSKPITAGAACQLDFELVNKGKADVWIGPGWALRIRTPSAPGRDGFDGNGPRPSEPFVLHPGQRFTPGAWSFRESTPGRYTVTARYTSGDGARSVTTPDVVIEVK